MLTIQTKKVPYLAEAVTLYQQLCGDSKHNLLLESAEIDSKQGVKTLMIIDCALRIVCVDESVTFYANGKNGSAALDMLEQGLTQHAEIHYQRESMQLTMQFEQVDSALDEDARLQQKSTFDALRILLKSVALTDLPPEALFLGGLFAYDLVAQSEPLPEVPRHNRCPDYVFFAAQTLLVIDHKKRTAHLQITQFSPDADTTAQLRAHLDAVAEQCQLHAKTVDKSIDKSNTANRVQMTQQSTDCVEVSVSDADFCQQVSALKAQIIDGELFQVVPSRRFRLPCPKPLAAYRELKRSNPSPYLFYLQDSDFTLFGASPESALKYDKSSNQVEIYPIAGTRPRGKQADGSIDLDLDGRIELELRNDEKENAEHMMLVDLARNDIARIAIAGTRYVANLLNVDRYSHVMHLVSRVVGQLRPELDALYAYQACMNMGTLTGAPKIRAMQWIRHTEKTTRGSYGGAVGYLNGNGDMDTCIVIRSAYIEDGMAEVQAGAGVVFDSIPQAEADETRAKAQAVVSAILAVTPTRADNEV